MTIFWPVKGFPHAECDKCKYTVRIEIDKFVSFPEGTNWKWKREQWRDDLLCPRCAMEMLL